jgi:hypothetical protein
VAQNRKLNLKHPSTHKFPEMLPCDQLKGAGLMTFKWVPIAAETCELPSNSQATPKQTPMTGISDFVQQSHNFIAVW